MCQFLKKICATKVQPIDFKEEREVLAVMVGEFNESKKPEDLEKLDLANQELLQKIADKQGKRSEKILSEGGSSLSGRKYSISCSEPNDRLPTTVSRERANTIGDMKADSTTPTPWCGSKNIKYSKGFKVQHQAADEVPRPGIPESSTLSPPTPTHEKKL